jgi:hypothetical protein
LRSLVSEVINASMVSRGALGSLIVVSEGAQAEKALEGLLERFVGIFGFVEESDDGGLGVRGERVEFVALL